jgi:hypothetical protein
VSNVQSLEQILPERVIGLNQVQLSTPWPFLQSFLTPDRCLDILVPLHVHEMRAAVANGETRAQPHPVLPRPPRDIVRHSNIERAECLPATM